MKINSDKIAFLIVIIVPFSLIFLIAWLLMGEKIVQSKVAWGYLNGISIMIIPTLIAVAAGLVIRYLFFRKKT